MLVEQIYTNLKMNGIVRNKEHFSEHYLECDKNTYYYLQHKKREMSLGNMLKAIGRIKEAKILLKKTIQINKEFGRPYYSLSRMQFDSSDKKWRDNLFSAKFSVNNQNHCKKWPFPDRGQVII